MTDAHMGRRLSSELVAWLSTVRPDGRPHCVPVWFLWDDPTAYVFTVPGLQKLRNIAHNPNVVLTLDSADGGNDIVIVEGTAEVLDPASLSAATLPGFAEKYGPFMGGQSPEEWAAQFSQPIRITATRVFGWKKSLTPA